MNLIAGLCILALFYGLYALALDMLDWFAMKRRAVTWERPRHIASHPFNK